MAGSVLSLVSLGLLGGGAGVSAPGLARLAAEAFVGGIILGVLSAALIWVPVRLAAGR